MNRERTAGMEGDAAASDATAAAVEVEAAVAIEAGG